MYLSFIIIRSRNYLIQLAVGWLTLASPFAALLGRCPMALVAVDDDPPLDWEKVPARNMVFLDKLPGSVQPGGSHLLVNTISGQRHMWGDGHRWLIGFQPDDPFAAFIYDSEDPAQDPVDVFSLLDQQVWRKRS